MDDPSAMTAMTTTELAAALGVHKATIRNMIEDGRLPPPDFPAQYVGSDNEWSAERIAPYLPGGPKAPRKLRPGRKPGGAA